MARSSVCINHWTYFEQINTQAYTLSQHLCAINKIIVNSKKIYFISFDKKRTNSFYDLVNSQFPKMSSLRGFM